MAADWRVLYKIIAAMVLLFLSHLNVFFLKWILWIPPEHPYLTVRLVLLGLLALHCFREYYEFCCNRAVHRLGQNAWLLAILTIAETILVLKLGEGQFEQSLQPAPYIVQCWALGVGAFVAWSVWRFAFRSNWVPRDGSQRCVREGMHGHDHLVQKRAKALVVVRGAACCCCRVGCLPWKA
jgi:phosphatidylserine synthase 2